MYGHFDGSKPVGKPNILTGIRTAFVAVSHAKQLLKILTRQPLQNGRLPIMKADSNWLEFMVL